MKLTEARLYISGALIIFFSIAAAGQLTVDATGPVRQRAREAKEGSSGSAMRRLPLQVAIEMQGTPAGVSGKSVVEFVLTNSGKSDIIIPISPHPGDLEPTDPKVSYAVKRLNLYITSDKGKKGENRSDVLPGGTYLYGNQQFAGTLTTLASGESIRVLTLVAFPANSITGASPSVFIAHAWLCDQTMKIVNGQYMSDDQEIGSASSPGYTPEALFKALRGQADR